MKYPSNYVHPGVTPTPNHHVTEMPQIRPVTPEPSAPRHTLADSPSVQLFRVTPPELLPLRAEYCQKTSIADGAIIRFSQDTPGNYSALIDPTRTPSGTLIGGPAGLFMGLVTDNFNQHQLANSNVPTK